MQSCHPDNSVQTLHVIGELVRVIKHQNDQIAGFEILLETHKRSMAQHKSFIDSLSVHFESFSLNVTTTANLESEFLEFKAATLAEIETLQVPFISLSFLFI